MSWITDRQVEETALQVHTQVTYTIKLGPADRFPANIDHGNRMCLVDRISVVLDNGELSPWHPVNLAGQQILKSGRTGENLIKGYCEIGEYVPVQELLRKFEVPLP